MGCEGPDEIRCKQNSRLKTLLGVDAVFLSGMALWVPGEALLVRLSDITLGLAA